MTSGRYSLTCLLVAEIEQHELADTEKGGVISQWTAAFLVPVAYGVVSPAFAAMFQVGSTFISLTELSWTGWKQKRGRKKLSSLSRYTAWKQSYIHHAKKEVTINTKERRSNLHSFEKARGSEQTQHSSYMPTFCDVRSSQSCGLLYRVYIHAKLIPSL